MPSLSEHATPSKTSRTGTSIPQITPEIQAIAAHRSFAAHLRGDAASDELPMLTDDGHRSVKNMRPTTNISDTGTETPAKKTRTSSQSGTTFSVSNIHSADNSNNDGMIASTPTVNNGVSIVCPTSNGLDEGGLDELNSFFQDNSHDDSAVSTALAETAVPASAVAAAANIAGELEFRPNGGGEPPSPPGNGGVPPALPPPPVPPPPNGGVPPALDPPLNEGVPPALEPPNGGVPPALPPPDPPLRGNLERYSSSKGSHIKMGTTYFLHFLNSRRADLSAVALSHLPPGCDITDKDKVPVGVFTIEVLDKFSDYLSSRARLGVSEDPTISLISAGTADNYFSAIKTYYTSHHPAYKHKAVPPSFEGVKWKMLRGGLNKSLRTRAIAGGVPLSNPREMLTDEDFKIMALLCLWEGSIKFMMFLTFQCLLFQVGGRGAESASRKFGHLSTRKYVADGFQSDILTIFIQRDKTLRSQHCTLFPQADISLWWKDLSFLLALNIILNSTTQGRLSGLHDPIFPEFHKENEKDNTRESSGRKQKKGAVSGLFSSMFKVLLQIYDDSGQAFHGDNDYVLNHKLGSHSAKKLTCQTLADFGCNPISTIFRVGWDLRSVHTLFDYIVGSKVLDEKAGRTLSGWYNVSHGSGDSGGLPPNIDDALAGLPSPDYENQKTEILLLGKTLFAGTTTLDQKVLLLLLGALFKHWNAMIDCYEEDPEQHPIVFAVTNALHATNISPSSFKFWCDNTEDNFKLKNLQGLPVRQIHELPGDALIDVRTFRHFIDSYKSSMCHMIRETAIMKTSFVKLLDELKKSPRPCQPEHDNNKENAPRVEQISTSTTTARNEQVVVDTGSPVSQMSFTRWYEKFRVHKNCIEVFLHFHIYNLEGGHLVDLVKQKEKFSTVAPGDEQAKDRIKKANKDWNNRYHKHITVFAELQFLLGPMDPCPTDVFARREWETRITTKLMEIFKDRMGGSDKIASMNNIMAWHSKRKKQSLLN